MEYYFLIALCHFSTQELSLKIISNFLFFMVIFRLPPQISPAFIKKYCSRDQKLKFTANIKIVVLNNFYVFWTTHLPSQIRCFNSNIKYLHFYSLSIGPKFVSFEIWFGFYFHEASRPPSCKNKVQ